MDCPVCYEAITKETGQVTTSCGHSFHFKCLNSWYYHQITHNEGGQESCPCCRKEPGEFERASLITESEEDVESQTISEPSLPENEWIQVGHRRWVIASSEEDRLAILAQVASELPKLDPFYIPPYDGEAHALWILRHLFEGPMEPAGPQDILHPLDKPKMVRRRRRSFGRTFWTHLGTDYKLQEIDGYKTD